MEYLPNEIFAVIGRQLDPKDLFSWMSSCSLVNSLPVWSFVCKSLAITLNDDLLLNLNDNLDWRLVLAAISYARKPKPRSRESCKFWTIFRFLCAGTQGKKSTMQFRLKNKNEEQIWQFTKELLAEYPTVHDKVRILMDFFWWCGRCQTEKIDLVHPRLALTVLKQILESTANINYPIISKEEITWLTTEAIRARWIDGFKMLLPVSNLEGRFNFKRKYSFYQFLDALRYENPLISSTETALTTLHTCISTVCDNRERTTDSVTFIYQCIESLIKSGANINAQTEPSKLTPLHLFIACLHPSEKSNYPVFMSDGIFSIVKLLVEVGKADLSLTNVGGLTPIHFAEIVQLCHRKKTTYNVQPLIDYLYEHSTHADPRPQSFCGFCSKLYDVNTNESASCQTHLFRYYYAYPEDVQEQSEWSCCLEPSETAGPCYIGYHKDPA